MPPEQVNAPAPIPPPEVAKLTLFFERKMVWMPIAAIIVFGGGAYFVMQPNFFGPNTTGLNSEQPTEDSSAWVSYENKDIGIAFEYPKTWGEIKIEKDGGCLPDYYDNEVSVSKQMIKEVNATDDPCNQVQLIANGEAFLATDSKLYTKYPPGRGGYWGDYAGGIQSVATVETYCANQSKENCSTYKNNNGILVARSFEDFGESWDRGWIYVIKSAHPFYNGVILYAGADIEHKKVIEQLVNTLSFVAYTPTASTSVEREANSLNRWLLWTMLHVGDPSGPIEDRSYFGGIRLSVRALHLSGAQNYIGTYLGICQGTGGDDLVDPEIISVICATAREGKIILTKIAVFSENGKLFVKESKKEYGSWIPAILRSSQQYSEVVTFTGNGDYTRKTAKPSDNSSEFAVFTDDGRWYVRTSANGPASTPSFDGDFKTILEIK